MKRIFLLIPLLCLALTMQAQKTMSPPTIMVVPDDIYCKTHGYTKPFNNRGTAEERPDYKRALTEDHNMHAVLTQIKELIMERNSKFKIIDLMTSIKSYEDALVMDAANMADESESVDEAIIRNSDADVLIKVDFNILKEGPERQAQFTITATDAYTNQQFAPVSGIGSPSTAANPAVLVREAIFGKMDAFLQQILNYYTNMLTDGRAVAFYFNIQQGAGVDMNTQTGEYPLGDVIDDMLYDNSVDGTGMEQVQGGDTFRYYRSVHIPLMADVRGRMRKQNAMNVARRIAQQLQQKYQIECSCKMAGLGKVYIYIK